MRVLGVTTAGSENFGPLLPSPRPVRDSGPDARVKALASVRATVELAGLPPVGW